MAKIKVGIIGVGGIGERVLTQFQAHPEIEVRGIFDTNNSRLQEISAGFSITAAGHYRELLDDPAINLIYIAVPPKFHNQFVLEALEYGKNVLCEKPLASTVAEAAEMLHAAEAKGLLHAVNFPSVFAPGFIELERLVNQGFLGALRRIELHCHFQEWPRYWQKNSWISSREQGGFVREVFPHFIQMIQQLFGDICDVTASLELPKDPDLCETGIIASGRMANGIPILLNGLTGIGMKEKLRFDLYGSEGTLSLLNWSELWASRINEPQTKLEVAGSGHYSAFMDELVQAFDAKSSRLVTFKQGYEVQKVLDTLLNKS
ncbi:Gfo/Idh/MocA family protein [Bacillus sp. FJAT-18017]|uniref:Gfo/Idh/MocA family protein n=1 Tax=Bacillus sp. FJAT-18017 TaxID=1705566 RepID=UPI0006AFE4A3|nr:Gfo/Idh/MocA family oxidoreductase [Bacillus sp. FJAT-18017]